MQAAMLKRSMDEPHALQTEEIISLKKQQGFGWWKTVCGGCCLFLILSAVVAVAAAYWFSAGRPVPDFFRRVSRLIQQQL